MRAASSTLLSACIAFGLAACDDGGGSGGSGGAGGAADMAAGGAGGGAGGMGGAGGGAGGMGGGAGGMGGDADAGVAQPDMELPPIDWVTPDGVAEPVDNTPADPGTCRASWVGAFRGWVADQSGRPVANAKAQACIITEPGGMLLCLRPADSDENGVYTISVPESGACMSSVAMRVLQPGTGLATIYCVEDPAQAVGGDTVVRTTDPYVVYPTDAATVPPSEDLDTPITIAYQDGLQVEVVPGRVFTTSATIEAARARVIDPADRGLCFLADQPTPDRLYAFWPEAAIDGAGAPFRVPNEGGLAAGAQVDLYVLGGLECALEDGTHIPEGEWFNFGTGTVSEDGAHIVNDAGSELPCFTWLGLKAR